MAALEQGQQLAPAPLPSHRARVMAAVESQASDIVECEPGCCNDQDEPTSCPECRALEMADRWDW